MGTMGAWHWRKIKARRLKTGVAGQTRSEALRRRQNGVNPRARRRSRTMSFQEYLKYLTRLFVTYMETPKDERRQRKTPKESWSSRWFGAIPMSIRLMWRK